MGNTMYTFAYPETTKKSNRVQRSDGMVAIFETLFSFSAQKTPPQKAEMKYPYVLTKGSRFKITSC